MKCEYDGTNPKVRHAMRTFYPFIEFDRETCRRTATHVYFLSRNGEEILFLMCDEHKIRPLFSQGVVELSPDETLVAEVMFS